MQANKTTLAINGQRYDVEPDNALTSLNDYIRLNTRFKVRPAAVKLCPTSSLRSGLTARWANCQNHFLTTIAPALTVEWRCKPFHSYYRHRGVSSWRPVRQQDLQRSDQLILHRERSLPVEKEGVGLAPSKFGGQTLLQVSISAA